MKNEGSKQKLNNAGTTLVELIVSILILAIIVTPALSSFITSMRVNKVAKEMGQAEAVAANIMEEVNFLGYTGINGAPTESGYQKVTPTPLPTDPDAGKTVFVKQNAIAQGDGTYNVRLTFDKNVTRTMTDEGGASKVVSVNDQKFADISDLNKNSTVLINREIGAAATFEDFVLNFEYGKYRSEEGHEHVSMIDFLMMVKKELCVKVDKDPTLDVYTIESSVNYYYYTGDWAGRLIYDSIPEGGTEEDGMVGTIMQSVENLDSMYILYNPISEAFGGTITLNPSRETVRLEIGSNVSPEKKFRAYIVIQAPLGIEVGGTVQIDTNNSSHFTELRSQIASNNAALGATTDAGNLGTQEEVERIYGVTVEISDTDGNVLTTLESSVMH